MLERQLGLLPECGDERGPPLHGLQAVACEAAELMKIRGTQIGKLMLLEIAPDVFGGVELGRVAGQRLDLNRSVELLQVVTYQAAAVRRQPIPDDQQLALDLPLRARRNSMTCGPLMVPGNRRK